MSFTTQRYNPVRPLPLVSQPEMGLGRRQAARRPLSARWQVANGHLVCQWVAE